MAKRRGWVDISHTSKRGHIRLEYVDGSIITAATTPSDHRALMNFRADLRRVERRSKRS